MFSKVNLNHNKNKYYNNKTYLIEKMLAEKAFMEKDLRKRALKKYNQITEKLKNTPNNNVIEPLKRYQNISQFPRNNQPAVKNLPHPSQNLLQQRALQQRASQIRAWNNSLTFKNRVNNNNLNRNVKRVILEYGRYSHKNMIIPFNVNRIRSKGITIINNVYQQKYNFGKSKSSGLGDFIRGSYFILEFCEEYKFQPKIVFNNEYISKFLTNKTHNLDLINNLLSEIEIFKNNNFSDYNIINGVITDPKLDKMNIMSQFVDYVVERPAYYGNVFIFCNSFPRNKLSKKHIIYMRKIMEPIDEIKELVNDVLDELNLTFKGYIAVHIRAGDTYLKDENNNDFNINYIINLVKNILYDINYIKTNNNYLLIADNNAIKEVIQKYFPEFKVLVKPITHFGENVVLEEEKVKNTLVDFYLLAYAKAILAYSSYQHGSGFSYWCAKTFDVPYRCKYVV